MIMKKYLLLVFFALVTLGTYAQRTPHAIGAHFGGSTIDLEYQYHFNNKNFFDVTAGVFDLDDGFSLQGVYNWNIKQWPNWTPGLPHGNSGVVSEPDWATMTMILTKTACSSVRWVHWDSDSRLRISR